MATDTEHDPVCHVESAPRDRRTTLARGTGDRPDGLSQEIGHRLGRTRSGGRRAGDESAVGANEWDAVSRWESEGGNLGEVREANVEDVRKTVDEAPAKRDSMTNIDANAVEQGGQG